MQESEEIDLFGVNFTVQPDMRRLLMWVEIEGHALRTDYVVPFDYKWEPTTHDEILEKHKKGKVII